MKKIRLVWMIFHLVFIIAINTSITYSNYCGFNNIEKDNAFIEQIMKILNFAPFEIYSKYTGVETGYGFFGINVRSYGLFIGECDGRKITPEFNSFEIAFRFSCLENYLSNDFLKTNKNNYKHAKEMEKYRDLIIKIIAVKLYNDNNCKNNSLILSYNLLDFPSLVEFRKHNNAKYKLIELKRFNYILDVNK